MTWRQLLALVLSGLVLLPSAGTGQSEESDLALLRQHKADTDGPGLIKFFQRRTLSEEQRKKIDKLIVQLDADSFEDRADAQKALEEIGLLARPQLARALASESPEVRKRVRKALMTIGPATEEALLVPAAARVLAKKKQDGAAETLLNVLPSIEDPEVAEEVIRVLPSVSLDKNGKLDAVVLAALGDRISLKRAAAGEALARLALKDHKPNVQKLLRDQDSSVRRRVALGLVEVRDSSGIPTLIELLGSSGSDDAGLAEDALHAIAGEKAPASPTKDTKEARAKYIRDWETWWAKEGAKLDLKNVELTAHRKYTLVVALDARVGNNGYVMELDAAGKQRWKIESLQYPVYASVARNDRVLICEYFGNKVSERDFKGNVIWQRTMNNLVLSADRLRNGNTLVVTRNQLVELDKAGKEVHAINRPTNDICAAHRDKNGGYTLICMQQIVRLDSSGKEVSSRATAPLGGLVGFRAHFLPKGGVIVPVYNSSQVIEYDNTGKEVSKTPWNMRPNSVYLQPNGNLLVTSRMALNRIDEIDRTGKAISSKTVEGRVMMASKR